MKNLGKSIIAILLIIAVILSVVFMVKLTFAEPLDTYHSEWVRIKDSAAEDGATFAASLALDANEGIFSSKPSGAYHIVSRGIADQPYTSSAGSKWMFAFYGTDAADETFSFTLVGWAKGNGMAQIICEGDGVLGTQDVHTEPNGDTITNGYWADTISLDETSKWPLDMGGDGANAQVYNSGDNEVCILVLDLAGLEWIDFVTYDVAGSAEASSIGIYGRLY